MSLKQKSINGMFWSFTETIGVKIFSVSVFLMLAKLLGPEPFGLVALTSSIVFLSGTLTNQGFVEALIQRKETHQEELSSAFWGIIGVGIFFFLCMQLLAPYMAKTYDEPQITEILRVHSISLVIGSIGLVHIAKLEKHFIFKAVAIA
ncbi:MAG: oligosaccharide flippase family protein, partial [Bacteroidota bacterium]